MPEVINQILRAELEQIGRHTERYYIEIDSDTHGTLKLCQRGETVTDAFDWIESVNGFQDGGGQVQDVSFILSKEAEQRVATEPLENHVCRIYIYRDNFIGKHHVRTGRVWSDETESGTENVYNYRVIGDLATALTGYLPERTFKGEGVNGYYQIPEGDKGSSIPLVLGTVDGWTPKLCKAGGWGYLAENMPAYSAPWTGEIKLSNNRGLSFMAPGLQTTLSQPITSKTATSWYCVSTTGVARDWKWFWVIAYKDAATFEIARSDGYASDRIVIKYRGALTKAFDTFVAGDGVYEISLVKIDNEIIAYRKSSSGALSELLRGINGEPTAHVKGARVQEYLPTLYWMVSSKACAVNSLKLSEIYFYDSATNSLVSNPFPDTEIRRADTQIETGQTVSVIRIHSQFGSQPVGVNNHYTANQSANEVLDMDTITTEDDDTANWTDTANAIDGNMATYARYSPNITTETLAFQTLNQIYPPLASGYNDWINPGNAYDGNENTFALFERDANSSSMQNSISVFCSVSPTNPDQVFRVEAYARGYWHQMQWGALFAGFNYVPIEVISTNPVNGWQSKTIFQMSWTGEINASSETFFQTDDAYVNGGGAQLFIAYQGQTSDQLASTAGVFEFKADVYQTSHGCLKTRNTGAVTNKAQTVFTTVEMHISQGDWEISYNDGAWYPITSEGQTPTTYWVIPGSDAWTQDSDWQGYIRLRPKYRDIPNKLVHEIQMVNYYRNYGNWHGQTKIYDGSEDTYGTYFAETGGLHYGEFYRNTAVNSMANIRRVRIKITYQHNLSVTCQVGIGAASGGSTPPVSVIWHSFNTSAMKSTIYIDVTEDNTSGWTWSDFNTTGSGKDYSIYFKVQGTNDQYMNLYEVSWDILTNLSQVDPLNQPMVVNCKGPADAIGGVYTETGGVVIENPADAEVFILIDQKHISADKIDLVAYRRLRDYFDGLCYNGVKCATVLNAKTATDEWLRSYRKEFNYHVDDVRGKLTPRFWPLSTAIASETINEDNIRAGSFTRWRTGMEEVVNAPVIYFNKSFYSSDKSKTVLAQIREKVPMIRRKLGSLFDIQKDTSAADTQTVYRDVLSVSDLIQDDEYGNDWSAYYLLATQSYQAYGEWYQQILEFNHIRDIESTRAMAAEILRRKTMQRWCFKFDCDPSLADRIAVWDVCYLQHRVIPVIPGKITYSTHAELGTIRTAKVVVLSIVPNGRWRVIICEVL